MGLLTDIYNTVAKFFRAQDTQGEDASKSVAQNRLKLVLMQDRTNLTPKVLEQMRGEMIDLLSKYLEMDKDLLELNFEQEGDQVALMLSIPVIRAKDEDEIELACTESNEDDSEETDEECDSEDGEDCDSECENEDNNTECSDEEVKPKRKRSKKVSNPEGLEEEHHSENNEPVQELVFENSEG